MTLASLKQKGNFPVSKDLLMQSNNTENVNFHTFKKFVGISPVTDLLFLRSLTNSFISFIEAGQNENFLVILQLFYLIINNCLIVLMLG